jgi:hypothetical protein
LLELDGGIGAAFREKQGNHLAEGDYASVPAQGGGSGAADFGANGRSESVPVREAIVHEARKGFVSIKSNVTAFASGFAEIQGALRQAMRQAITMLRGGNDYRGVSRNQGRTDKSAQRFDEKGIVGIELDDVTATFACVPMRQWGGLAGYASTYGGEARNVCCTHVLAQGKAIGHRAGYGEPESCARIVKRKDLFGK